MSSKLDRKKPFGEIFGDSKGRRFEQDGAYFAPDGSEWVDPDAAVQAKPSKPAKPTAKTESAPAPEKSVNPQLDAQLKG